MKVLLLLAAWAGAAVDNFGVTQVYPSEAGGTAWHADFGPPARSYTGSRGQDAVSNWLHWRGNATYAIDGAGQLSVSGSGPRIFVYDPALEKQWRNVEMTVYARRVADSGVPNGGIVGVVRSNHREETTQSCDTRGYVASMRNDGHVLFGKEVKHPSWVTGKTVRNYFPGGLPFKQWIGYKYVVYDMPNGDVVSELWIDWTDGASGGTWMKIDSFTDTGTNLGVGSQPCAGGVDPALRLRSAAARQGSETGKPNLSVYLRNTDVGANGMAYKKLSVREIAAPFGEGIVSPDPPIASPAPADDPAAFSFHSLFAFPNPARRSGVTIRLRTGRADSADIAIYDASGARLRTGSFTGPSMIYDSDGLGTTYTFEYKWDGAGAAPGVYSFAATARKAGSPDIVKMGRVALIK